MSAFDRLNQTVSDPHVNGAQKPRQDADKPRSRGRKAETAGKPPRWWGVLCGFVGNHLRNVSPQAACVWLVLFRNSKDGIAQETHEQIGAAAGMSARHVRRCLVELKTAELVRVESRGNRNKGPSRYRLLSTGQIRPVDEGFNRTDSSYRNRTDSSYTPRENRRGGTLGASAAGNVDGES